MWLIFSDISIILWYKWHKQDFTKNKLWNCAQLFKMKSYHVVTRYKELAFKQSFKFQRPINISVVSYHYIWSWCIPYTLLLCLYNINVFVTLDNYVNFTLSTSGLPSRYNIRFRAILYTCHQILLFYFQFQKQIMTLLVRD